MAGLIRGGSVVAMGQLVRARRDLPRVTAAALLPVVFSSGCVEDRSDALHASDVTAAVAEQVPLRTPTDEDFLLSQLLALGELEDVTDAEVVEARLLVDDTNEESFLIVAERDDGFDQDAMEVFIEVGEDLVASPGFSPVEGLERTFADEYGVVRFIDDVAVVAGDPDGQLRAAVLALE